jgi:hypothetical protein
MKIISEVILNKSDVQAFRDEMPKYKNLQPKLQIFINLATVKTIMEAKPGL